MSLTAALVRGCALVVLVSATVTAQLPAQSGIRHVATRNFTLVVKGDGSVVGWGRDPDGQAARPVSPQRVITTPVAIELPGKALQVALGETTQYALLENGSVVSWGTNSEGQLGNGPMGANGELGRYPKPSIVPVAVTGLTDVIQVAAGMKHAVALRKDGTVWAWGRRENGELGDGAPTGRVVHAIGPVRVKGLEKITQIAVDGSHNLALRADGRVFSWGLNHSGELGTGTRDNAWEPKEVNGLTGVIAIAAGTGGSGAGSSGAVREDGTVWMWGTGTSSMMGNGNEALSPDEPGGRFLVPTQVKGVTGATRIAIGAGHVGVLLKDKTVQTWGFDGYGQSGIAARNASGSAYRTTPVKVPGITNVAAIYLGGWHTMAVREDGSLWIWGGAFVTGPGLLGRNLRVPTLLPLE